jgi:hypothetical protein
MMALMYIQALYLAWFTSQEHFPVLDVAERLVHYGIHMDVTERDVDRLKKDLRRRVEEKARRSAPEWKKVRAAGLARKNAELSGRKTSTYVESGTELALQLDLELAVLGDHRVGADPNPPGDSDSEEEEDIRLTSQRNKRLECLPPDMKF